jgi:hypothetical protein
MDQLFEALIGFIIDKGYRKIEKFPEDFGPEKKIKHILNMNFKYFLEHPHYTRCMILLYYYSSFRPEFMKINKLISERAEDRFATLFLDCGFSKIDSKLASKKLHGLLIGSVIKILSENPDGSQSFNDFWKLVCFDLLLST